MKTGRFHLGLFALCALPGMACGYDLSIDITQPPGEPYDVAIDLIRNAGATATSLSLFWDDFEPEAGVYRPEIDWPAIANAYYPGAGIDLTLTFSVIDTVADRRPRHLQHLDWDDPELIDAFAHHLDAVLSRLPDVTVLSISIGNEIDGTLQTADDIAAFSRFLASARRTVEQWHPDVSVSAKLTFSSLIIDRTAWAPILRESTGLHVTYYPIGGDFAVRDNLDVAADVATLARIAGDLPVFILEAGYPSDGCGAAADGQSSFIRDIFVAGSLTDAVRLVSLTWLTDISAEEIDAYTHYYGVGDACFVRFLGSLGLRHADGRAKPGLAWLLRRK